MSFCSQLKTELMSLDEVKPCCALAETYGLLLFGKMFSKREIYISTENGEVAEKYKNVAERLSESEVEYTCSKSGKCRVSVKEQEGRLKILEAFGLSGDERSRRVNWANISDECCFAGFLRGVFLACGTINDPEKNYHIEFSVPYSLRNDLIRIFEEVELSAKEIKRNGQNVLYFKDSDEIVTLLTLMGANDSALEYIGVKVFKDVRNNVNRRTNFENANLDRTVNASLRQTQAIEKLKRDGNFEKLSPELKKIAVLRLENPELSLQQIGQMLEPPLSRSGVNHRLQKILNYAE